MNFARSLFAAAAFVATSYTGVSAADLPARVPAVAPAPLLIASNWTGFYVGGNIGYGCCGHDTVQAIQTAPVFAVVSPIYANLKPNGVFGGLQAGYNMQ